MTRALHVRLPWPPSTNRTFRSRAYRAKNTGRLRAMTYLSDEGRVYRQEVLRCVLEQGIQRNLLTGRLSVSIVACPPDRRARDLDNLLKSLLDSVRRAGLIRDDCDIDRLEIERWGVVPGGAVRVTITEIPAAVSAAAAKEAG